MVKVLVMTYSQVAFTEANIIEFIQRVRTGIGNFFRPRAVLGNFRFLDTELLKITAQRVGQGPKRARFSPPLE